MKYQRKIFRNIFLFFGILIMAYFSFMFLGGGFGKKQLNIDAMKNGNAPFLFAHRGISAIYPENSREAIEAAKLRGFKGLEVDIRKSSDNEFIVFHDEDGSRMLGIDRQIDELSTAQIKEHPLLFNNIKSKSRVLSVKELLDEFKDDFIIYFDMKLKGFDDIDDMVSIIKSYDITGSSILASTSGFTIFYIEYKYPEINTSLEGFNSGKEWIYCLFPKNYKPDFYSSFASKVDEDHIAWLQKRDLLLNRVVYGVDSTNYQSVSAFGIENMILDE